jgi:PQQ-like domain
MNGLQRLNNGNLLVVMRNGVLELDRDGKEVSTYARPGNDIFSAHKTHDGHLLVVTRAGQCTRVDAEGKEEKTFQIAGGVLGTVVFGSIDLLPTGRLLVPLGTQNKVAEVDDQGKLVWEAPFTAPSAVMRLPNGHTLATSYGNNRAAELDREGKEVWSYNGEGRLFRVRKR